MILLRHGNAAQNEFGIDFIRTLSEKGIKEVDQIKFPIESGFQSNKWNIWVSPARRTLETFQRLNTASKYNVLPELYAPILLPEMDDMYTEHGENIRPYITDSRIDNTIKITKEAAEIITRTGLNSTTLIVAHSLIIQLIVYHVFGNEKVFDINLGTAKGLWVKGPDEIIEF